MVQYDRTVLQQVADGLYAQASWVIVLSMVVYAIGGLVLGSGMGTGLGFVPGVGLTLGGSVGVGAIGGFLVGLFLGWQRGETKAREYRIRAQMLLVQMQIETNTAKTASASPTAAQASG